MASVSKAASPGVKALAVAVALAAAPPPARAVLSTDPPNACSDQHALKNIAFDARMTAVMMYYKGFIQNAGDRARQECLRTNVLQDDRFAVINRTMVLIDSECLPIEVAARRAMEGLCP